jgi:lysophospholipase L1-like esterase
MFRTEISYIESEHKFDLKTQILAMGSCFAENIGNRLIQFKFDVKTNPAGILFNPISICESIIMATDNQGLPSESYVQNESVYYNYKFHSMVNGQTKPELDTAINNARIKIKEQISNADYLILTFGTAWVYELANTNLLVANCHKVPQKAFTKRLLTVAEIEDKFSELTKAVHQFNPDLKIILTVSPIRHTREGLPNNGLSKAMLRLACHELCENFQYVNYFPAFEIMMDDLRDYRFYEKDMIHPNEQAQDYIWNLFRSNFLSESALKFTSDWQYIINAMNHRAFQPKSTEHQAFLKSTLNKVKEFSSLVNTKNEIDQLKKQII